MYNCNKISLTLSIENAKGKGYIDYGEDIDSVFLVLDKEGNGLDLIAENTEMIGDNIELEVLLHDEDLKSAFNIVSNPLKCFIGMDGDEIEISVSRLSIKEIVGLDDEVKYNPETLEVM